MHALPGRHLHTGDIGFMDEQGWFYVVDRKKDMIIASGYKVWPREVESVLYQHPAVRGRTATPGSGSCSCPHPQRRDGAGDARRLWMYEVACSASAWAGPRRS